MASLHVDVNDLIVGKRYTVRRTGLGGQPQQLNGTFSDRDIDGGIIFRDISYADGRRSGLHNFPAASLTNITIDVVPELSGELNRHINSFLGGKRRTKRRGGRRRTRRS